MANRLYNKQVTPKGYSTGGRIEKVPGGYSKEGSGRISDKGLKGRSPTEAFKQKEMFKGSSKGMRVKKAMGGSLKPVDKNKNPGLAKLPTQVRNKMGYMKDGGKVKAKKSKAIHPLDHPDVKMTQKMYAKNKIYAGTKEEVAKNLDKIQNKIAKKRTKTEGSS